MKIEGNLGAANNGYSVLKKHLISKLVTKHYTSANVGLHDLGNA